MFVAYPGRLNVNRPWSKFSALFQLGPSRGELSQACEADPMGAVNILMYHSVAPGEAPLCMAPELFRRQLDSLQSLGYQTLTLTEYVQQRPSADAAVLTFDDGYRDLLTTVAPELSERGLKGTVFLASDTIDSGILPSAPGAQLIDWQGARELVEAGWEIGSHTCSHHDLTKMTAQQQEREVRESRQRLEQELGIEVSSFAAPYGKSNSAVRELVAKHYRCSVSTRLARPKEPNQNYELPRIEMYYFTSIRRWDAFLEGRGESYFRCRQFLRRAKELAT